MQIIHGGSRLSAEHRRLIAETLVSGYSQVLDRFVRAGRPMRDAIDGGAGAGDSSEAILRYLAPGSRVFAFEPFTGNHRFFEGRQSEVVLLTSALSAANGSAMFKSGKTVPADSSWNGGRLAGYSSGGRLVAGASGDYAVETVRGDDAVPDPHTIDFVKLDLEGGEVDALRGMPAIVRGTTLMWVEYKGGDQLLDVLVESDPLLLDTSYLIFGEPEGEVLEHFSFSSTVAMSSGRTAWYGYRRQPWSDYRRELADVQARFQVVQTDLLWVNRSSVSDFVATLSGNL